MPPYRDRKTGDTTQYGKEVHSYSPTLDMVRAAVLIAALAVEFTVIAVCTADTKKKRKRRFDRIKRYSRIQYSRKAFEQLQRDIARYKAKENADTKTEGACKP